MPEPGPGVDYRFSLANERTYLAWIRTAFALVAGGIVAAKALGFGSEFALWAVAAPPFAAGAFLALEARSRWSRYESAMRAGEPLAVGRRLNLIAILLCAYIVVCVVAIALDR